MQENTIKRVPPHHLEAEQAVIGSMIMDADALEKAAETLIPVDFYDNRNAVYFSAMKQLYQAGTAVDLITLQAKLQQEEVADEMSSTDALRRLVINLPTSANVLYYIKILQQNSLRRQMIRITEEILNGCYAGKETAEELIEGAQDKIFSILSGYDGLQDTQTMQELVIATVDRLEDIYKNRGCLTGLKSGFRLLDNMTAGLQASDFILIAGRPSMGKTAFVLNIVEYVAASGGRVAVFSMEMSREQLMKRMISAEARVDAGKFRTGQIGEEEWGRIMDAARRLGRYDVLIDDAVTTVSAIRSRCRKIKSENGLDLVVIDYLQLMSAEAENGRIENRQQEISTISRNLKLLAKELEVPVVALSQLSRAVEQRQDKRPMLSDLRESGAIEQDADVVIFLYRDEYYDPNTERRGQAEVIIAKQRNGPTGSFPLAWIPQYTRFGNLEGKG